MIELCLGYSSPDKMYPGFLVRRHQGGSGITPSSRPSWLGCVKGRWAQHWPRLLVAYEQQEFSASNKTMWMASLSLPSLAGSS